MTLCAAAGQLGDTQRVHDIQTKYTQQAQAGLESMGCALTDAGCTQQGCGVSSRHSAGVVYSAGTHRCNQQALSRGAVCIYLGTDS